jgi:mono/diheme cytochrome c family protein
MSCGVPWKLWADPSLGALAQGALGGADGTTIEGRHGHNTDLPYTLNAFTTADGAEVVNRNCLGCHGGHFDGELVLGLGNAAADFTTSISEGTPESIPDSALDLLGLTDAEKSNLQKILRFSRVAAERLTMRAVGLNPAEQLTGVLLAHHDQTTLAWSDEPLMPIVEPTDEEGNPIPDARLVSDPPPWWRAHKKHALFYNGMARGDQRGTMALATAVCVDSVEEAQRVDDLFRDMHSYVLSIRAPEYTRSIDGDLASEGKGIFETTCAGCHGSYADDPTDDENDTYPNLLIPLDVIGTDTAVAQVPIDNHELTDWYNGSSLQASVV